MQRPTFFLFLNSQDVDCPLHVVSQEMEFVFHSTDFKPLESYAGLPPTFGSVLLKPSSESPLVSIER